MVKLSTYLQCLFDCLGLEQVVTLLKLLSTAIGQARIQPSDAIHQQCLIKIAIADMLFPWLIIKNIDNYMEHYSLTLIHKIKIIMH